MLSGHHDRCLSHSLVTGISGLARAGCWLSAWTELPGECPPSLPPVLSCSRRTCCSGEHEFASLILKQKLLFTRGESPCCSSQKKGKFCFYHAWARVEKTQLKSWVPQLSSERVKCAFGPWYIQIHNQIWSLLNIFNDYFLKYRYRSS